MSRRIESRRMQRARRRRRRLVAKMVVVLALFVVSITVCVKLISKAIADSDKDKDIAANNGSFSEEAGTLADADEKEKEVPPMKDLEPPVIQGVEELTVPAGSPVSYKRNVTATDNRDGEVAVTVDASQVDLNTLGDYTVVYKAKDAAGNEAEVSTVVHVVEASADTATEDQVNAKADELLAQITTAEMSEYEKAQAIFFWVHDNVAWSDHSPKDGWVSGAYRGLVERKGDCYVYAMTAKCLLTRAGIKNMDIEKIPTDVEHYWNLIDLGDGWYHYDTTRRKDKQYFFYTSDEDLMNYSRSHEDSHNYDPAQYPEIQ